MSAYAKIPSYAAKSERLVVGLISGTSVDGVDAALVRISGAGRTTAVQTLAFLTMPYSAKLRETILRLCRNRGGPQLVSQTNVAIGAAFADAADAVLKRAGVAAAEVDAIASHGQTISHTPASPPKRKTKRPRVPGATLQIGESAIIAERLGVLVVSDFQAADVAAGGQGAPLVPYADWCLLTHPTKSRAVQNIGGIGNVTYLPADAAREQVIGFDTGPGNMIIDRAVQWATNGEELFDRDGRGAAEGKPDYDMVAWLLNHPSLLKAPPKSAGREDFGEAFWEEILRWKPRNSKSVKSGADKAASWVQSLIAGKKPAPPARAVPADLLATLTTFTALSIADAYERFLPALPDEIILGGGGAHNRTLLKMLGERFGADRVKTHDSPEIGINGDAKEAIAFAVLANETLLGNSSNLPSVTGARRTTTLGKMTLP